MLRTIKSFVLTEMMDAYNNVNVVWFCMLS